MYCLFHGISSCYPVFWSQIVARVVRDLKSRASLFWAGNELAETFGLTPERQQVRREHVSAVNSVQLLPCSPTWLVHTVWSREEGNALASRAAAIRSRFTITANWRGGIETRTGRWATRSGLNGVAMTMPPLAPGKLTSADSGASPKFIT